MASLSPPLLPSSNLRSLKRTTVAATSDHHVPGTLISSIDPKRPWWTPLFRKTFRDQTGSEDPTADEAGSDGSSRKEVRRSGLTAEKARVLRREMRATEIWHDAMYHSAIASRLASPDQQP